MARFSKSIAAFSLDQAKNLVKYTTGRPLVYPSLNSMTLDKDDVAIARLWLENKSAWYDECVTAEYEEQFALWNGSQYAFAFMSGRVALSACIYALGLKHGDEVILPGYTCVVVPNAFDFAEVSTVYSDIELDTYGLDASFIEDKITSNTKAILMHHLYGLVSRDYEEIVLIARKHNLYVIEDCVQSIGAIYKNRKIGNYGDIAFYSSEQSKGFNTIQGGMATTNDDSLARRLKSYYDQAKFPDAALVDKQLHCVIVNYFSFKDPGRWWKRAIVSFVYQDKILISTTREEEDGVRPAHYGCKMPAAIAAIGVNQLKKLEDYNSKRRRTAKQWDKWCDMHGYVKPCIIPDSTPVYLRYPVMVEKEKKTNASWAYKELQISLGVWFVTNIHPVARLVEDCPNADRAVSQCVNFPTLLE